MPTIALISLLLDGVPIVVFAALDGWFEQTAFGLVEGSRPATSPSTLVEALTPFTLILGAWSFLATTRLAVAVVARRPLSMTRSLSLALGRLPSGVWAVFAFTFTGLGLATLPGIVMFILVREGWIAPAIGIGVIAVIMGSTMLFGVFPALVIDGARGFKAVGRSWRLARSHLGGSTIVIGSMLLSTWGVSITIQLLTRIPLEPDGWGAILGASIAAVLGALTFSISAVVAVSLYLRLREGSGRQMSSAELAARLDAFDSRTAPHPPRPDAVDP